MAMVEEYSVLVGSFFLNEKGINLEDSELQIPLVNGIDIGRAANDEEQKLCGNDLWAKDRPSYNGKKIIIPGGYYPGLNMQVSRLHGRLRLNENKNFYYEHLSRTGMGTSLWVPGGGLVQVVKEFGQTIGLRFSKNEQQEDRYLLLGGRSERETITEMFPYGYYSYVLIRKIGADKSKN